MVIGISYLQELLKTLTENEKSETDVLWAGNTSYQIPWEEFKRLLCDASESSIYRHDLYWAIPEDLLVVGGDFLIRLFEDWDDDTDPIWEYIAVPATPKTTIHLKSLILPEELRKPYIPHTLEEQVKFEN